MTSLLDDHDRAIRLLIIFSFVEQQHGGIGRRASVQGDPLLCGRGPQAEDEREGPSHPVQARVEGQEELEARSLPHPRPEVI